MAGLPHAAKAFVPDEKFALYLVPTHKVGGPKLKFLESFGFDRADREAMRTALIAHAGAWEAAVIPTPFGVKYEVDGPLTTPSGVEPWVRTVWHIDDGAADPRFVTLKPLTRPR